MAFIGGSGMVKQVESGALESFLTHAVGNHPVYLRDLAWQADTVYQRQRPRNFGTQAEALDRIGATTVVVVPGVTTVRSPRSISVKWVRSQSSTTRFFSVSAGRETRRSPR